MNKFILGPFLIMTLVFNACGGNDDDGSSKECQTCNQEFAGEIITSEICDNGNGTFTITFNGEEETEDLNVATFEQIIAAYEEFGASCD